MKAAEDQRWWKGGAREPETIFLLFCFRSTSGGNEKRLIMALEFPSEWGHFHIGMEWVHTSIEAHASRAHTNAEEMMRRNAIRKQEWDSIPLWPNQCDWWSAWLQTHTYKTYTGTLFPKALWKGQRAKWNNSTCYLSRDSTTPISPLFHFVPMGKEKGNTKPCTSLFTEMVSKGWRTQVLYTRQDMTLTLHWTSKAPFQNSKTQNQAACNN